jgi:hypothetical protein
VSLQFIYKGGEVMFKLDEDYEITELSANLGFTVNLGNFESARVDQGMTVKLLRNFDTEEVKALSKQLNKSLRSKVFKEIKTIMNEDILSKED